jgi:hypothetical protein
MVVTGASVMLGHPNLCTPKLHSLLFDILLEPVNSPLIMRVLQLQGMDEFSLVRFIDDDIPQYAILSHTWGLDNEEVTFEDILKSTGKGKLGYAKI